MCCQFYRCQCPTLASYLLLVMRGGYMQQHQNKHTPKAVPTNLGDFLRQTREQRGISIRQLAASMHLDFGYLSRLEKGVYTKPSPEVLQRIARALDISYEDLFAFTGYQLPQGL